MVMHEQAQHRLWKAAAAGDSKTIRMIVMGEFPVDIDARNDEGFTAFNLATANGHADAAMTILAVREMQQARKMGLDPADYFKLPKEAPAAGEMPSPIKKKRA